MTHLKMQAKISMEGWTEWYWQRKTEALGILGYKDPVPASKEHDAFPLEVPLNQCCV